MYVDASDATTTYPRRDMHVYMRVCMHVCITKKLRNKI